MNVETKDLLEVATLAAEDACHEILRIYQWYDLETEYKDNNTPLTIADKRAHEVIARRLRRHTPYPILSEEGEEPPYARRKQWEYFWLVDPLDGTKEFIKKNDEFTVNIALVHQNVPVLGIVAAPALGEFYFGMTGEGASFKKAGKERKLAKRKSANLEKPNLRVVASRSHLNGQTETFIQELDNPTMVSVGSSLKFMILAKGEADVYPRFTPSMEWDTAAAHVIINELGLKIKNVFNDESLTYNKPNLLNPYFICF